MTASVIAFDIGGTTSRIALFKGKEIVWRNETGTLALRGPEMMLETMLELHRPINHLTYPVGVAIAGLVRNGEVFANNQDIMKGWNNFPLEKILSQKLNRPIMVCNDARAAAWGEYCYGVGKGCEQFLFITVSTGIGAGLVLNQRLHLARNGFDAELGETLTATGGNLENTASGTALNRIGWENGFLNGRLLCDAAAKGNVRAEGLYREGIRELAKKIADMVVLLGIEKIAIGGGVGLRPGYIERLREELLHFGPLYQCTIVPAKLGHEAGLHGVATLLHDRTNQHQDEIAA